MSPRGGPGWAVLTGKTGAGGPLAVRDDEDNVHGETLAANCCRVVTLAFPVGKSGWP
jgi:hypothetical protein